jgi:hypothetical protein
VDRATERTEKGGYKGMVSDIYCISWLSGVITVDHQDCILIICCCFLFPCVGRRT